MAEPPFIADTDELCALAPVTAAPIRHHVFVCSGKSCSAVGSAEVIEAFAAHGVHSSIMIMGGGASRSPLVRQIMADTTGLTVALPQTKEPVLLGAAMLGAVAGGACVSIGETMAKMSALGGKSEPTAQDMATFHARKREVYKLLREVDRGSRAAMRDIARG